nr:MAG TPA: hypothetical protein [Microviridae sp.]
MHNLLFFIKTLSKLHYVTLCIPASSKMTERCSRSRAHEFHNFLLSLKMCKDKV